MKEKLFIFILIFVILVVIGWWRAPLKGDGWSIQTIYVGLLDTWYGASTDNDPHALWIDDDSREGVFRVKKIADYVGIIPCFAVIADRMTPQVAESLSSWQRQESAKIIYHGLRHERWKDWSEEQIEADILQSRQRLHEQGFDTTQVLRIVIPPHDCNTRAIRKAIQKQGCQMITGASLLNPDRHVFQLGRIAITPETDIEKMRLLLQKAYKRNAFVILGTHSSMKRAFSEEKTKKVLEIAKEIGFDFDFYE